MIAIFALALVSISAVSPPPPSASSAAAEEHSQWLLKCLLDINTLKVGSTRAEVLKIFTVAGGWSTPRECAYVYRGSRYICVEVVYETALDKDGRTIAASGDKIVKISKPTIEIPPAD